MAEPQMIAGVKVPKALEGKVTWEDGVKLVFAPGTVPNMRVPGAVFANEALVPQLFAEFGDDDSKKSIVASITQVCNVASLPGILKHSLGMPDAHSGYGFSIGGVAAMDADNPEAVVCPGGVGYDINCGVTLLRTNLTIDDIEKGDNKTRLAEDLFKRIPVGVGAGGITLDRGTKDIDDIMSQGANWLVEKGLAWPEDLECIEENGCIKFADPSCVSHRAKGRGLAQCGSLGSGNHYIEVQVVDEIMDPVAAERMGITRVGQICVMIHSGSRGLGHQICTDSLNEMNKKFPPNPNDKQLTGVPIKSPEGQKYLKAMSAGANFAFVNRGTMRYHARCAFEHIFGTKAKKLDMHVIYDVCHNIAKFEDHVVDGKPVHTLVHRKGATRAFGPGNPCIPEKYRDIGQPIIIGGSMGTCSYVLTGTQKGMEETFGSTCHGAGRSLSRGAARREMTAKEVFDEMSKLGIIIKIATPGLVAEEAAGAYKDVSAVVQTCHDAGISKLCVRLRPIIVCKG